MAITKLNFPVSDFSSTGIDDNATSTAITIDASENVGIGTTSPSTDLDVRNNISMGDGTSVTQLSMTRNTANYIAATDASGYLVFRTGGNNERMRIDSSGNVIIKPSGRLYLESSSGFSPYLVEASNALTVNTNGTERMRINSNGGILAAPAYFFNSVASVTYNNTGTNNLVATYLQNHMTIVSIGHSAGNSNIIILSNGGSGIAYDFQMSNPASGTFSNTNAVSFTMAGSGGCAYTVSVTGGAGQLYVNRTSGSGSFTVYVNKILGAL